MAQGTLFFVWLMLLMSSLIAYNLDSASQGKGKEIAELLSSKGTVLFRLQDFSLWNPVSSKQIFTEGSVLATGRNSSAVIVVEDRVIKISAFTQISIMARKGSSDNDVLVTLLKGSLRTLPRPSNSVSSAGTFEKVASKLASKGVLGVFERNGNKRSQGLKLKAGKGTVELTGAKDDIRIQRDVNSDEMKVQVLQGKPSLSAALIVTPTSNTTAQEDIDDDDGVEEDELPDEKIPTPLPLPEKREVGLGFADVLPGTTYWTTEPFLKGRLSDLPIPLQTAEVWKSRAAWFGVVEFESEGKEKGKYGFSNSQESQLILTSDMLLKWGQIRRIGEQNRVLLTTRLGALAPEFARSLKFKKNMNLQSSIPKEVSVEMNEKWHQISLASVATLADGNINIQFSSFPEKWNDNSKKWFVQRKILEEKESNFTLTLSSKEEIAGVAGGLSLLPAYTIRPSKGSLSGTGTFYVRGNKVIAKLHGQSSGVKNALRLRDALNSDFIFEGAKNDFVSGPIRGKAGFSSLKKSINKGQKFFFLTRRGLVGVEGSLLSSFDAMSELFEQETIQAVFRRSVQIYDKKE